MTASRQQYDVVVVGGGHNGLTAAGYLAGAGLSTLVLERLGRTGGAAVSTEVFPGTGARLSPYSSDASLPQQVIHDLGLSLELRSAPVASYAGGHRDGKDVGLLVERPEGEVTAGSFRALTGSDAAYDAWRTFHDEVTKLAALIAPTLTQPLRPAREIAASADPAVWRALVEQPLSAILEERFADDLVRGLVASDALTGTFAALDDPSLAQNRCFLQHLVGAGERRVPVGGTGAVTDALERAAREAGAELVTGAGVSAIRPDADGVDVTFHDGSRHQTVRAGKVLADVAPWVLRILLGEDPATESKPEGAQVTISFLLSRLPALRSGQDPALAFAGSFHVATGYAELRTAYDEAAAGQVPTRPPSRLSCPSLTDPSTLGPLAADGVHSLTSFGMQMPASLFEGDREAARTEAVRRTVATIDEHLAESLMGCVLRDPAGRLCVEAKLPQDVEADLAMPGGHIFHGDLAWPWASNRELLATPAQRWGVATEWERVLLCGAGARRGAGINGLGGHNAAKAVLESH